MALDKVRREHWRLAILRLLKDGGRRANDSVIYDTLPHLGLHPSRDQVRGELHWLAEQGLVECREAGSLLVVDLSQRGLDVALGRVVVSGVRPPSPEL